MSPRIARCDERIRVIVAAEPATAERLAVVLSGAYVDVIAITKLDEGVATAVRRLDPDVVVMARGSTMEAARAAAEAVTATASRVTVMIVDDSGSVLDARVFWPRDRVRRLASRVDLPRSLASQLA